MKSNLDLVNECDTFPYATKDPTAYEAVTQDLYKIIYIPPNGTIDDDAIPIGYMPTDVLGELWKVPLRVRGEIEVNYTTKLVSVFVAPTEAERSQLVAATCNYWRENQTFKVLAGWRNELYPVYGPGNEVLWSVERAASPLFGILSYGVHMTAYTPSPESPYGIKLWIPRRSATKQTYASMLDNTVAGGTSTGETPFSSLLREASEEASLPTALVSSAATPHGTITYIYIRDARAGGETGLLQPECEYVYDLELPPHITPQPADGEVECFYLWTVDEVKEAMARGEFKPNCAMVLLDFFLRREMLDGDEGEREEVRERLHRVLEFPGPWRVEAFEETGKGAAVFFR